MKIKINEAPNIVYDLQGSNVDFVVHEGKGGQHRYKLTEQRVLDYAIEQAMLNNSTIEKELDTYRRCLFDVKVLKVVATRETILDEEELNNLYANLRCVTEMFTSYIREWFIAEMGFSDELKKALRKFTPCIESYRSGKYLFNNITASKLNELVDGNQELIDEFNNKVEMLGFEWKESLLTGKMKLNYKYGFDKQSYIEVEAKKFNKGLNV